MALWKTVSSSDFRLYEGEDPNGSSISTGPAEQHRNQVGRGHRRCRVTRAGGAGRTDRVDPKLLS
jgi:hypothetical protein